MADFFRPAEDAEYDLLDEWTLPTYNVECFGCGEEGDAEGQGIQPLVLSGS